MINFNPEGVAQVERKFDVMDEAVETIAASTRVKCEVCGGVQCQVGMLMGDPPLCSDCAAWSIYTEKYITTFKHFGGKIKWLK